MTAISLVHGWGYDASVWRDVTPLLAGGEPELIDLGYFGKSALATRRTGPRIAVGHSLGALWWLVHNSSAWDALVIINGFPRFTATADLPAGIVPRVLARMQRRFAQEPAEVLTEFQQTCGASGPALPADIQALARGLEFLAVADGRVRLGERRAAIHALASRDDAVVPAALSEAAFAALPDAQVHWCDSGGHVLPLTRPHDCAALIHAVAATLACR